MKCLLCEDSGWVCEVHQDQPWEGPHACTCGAAGAPCPALQSVDGGRAAQVANPENRW
jgi:hypothetical protein